MSDSDYLHLWTIIHTVAHGAAYTEEARGVH